MAVDQSYGAMLKRYMPEKLLENTFAKKNYIYQKIEKDPNWGLGTYEYPVEASGLGSIQMGALAAENDIAEGVQGVGTITHKEMYASILMKEADLARHGSLEKSYLKIMPDKIDQAMDRMQEQFSVAVLNGGNLALATVNGTVGGAITVDKPELFHPRQKVEVIDNDTAVVSGYVRTVDVNTGVLTIFNARTAGAVVDLSAFTVAQAARVRIIGSGTERFLDLKTALLPAASGGVDTLYGLTRADFMPLQATVRSGSGWTAATVLDDLTALYFDYQRQGRGKGGEILVNYGMFKNVSKKLELSKQYTTSDKKAGYGFNSVSLVGVQGELTITALREMPTSEVFIVDWAGIKFAGKEMFKKIKDPDGSEYHKVRASTGYSFITDVRLAGEVIVDPCKHACGHSIPASVSA